MQPKFLDFYTESQKDQLFIHKIFSVTYSQSIKQKNFIFLSWESIFSFCNCLISVEPIILNQIFIASSLEEYALASRFP